MLKKVLISSLCLMFAFSSVHALEGEPEEGEIATTAQTYDGKAFKDTLDKDGYAELGKYKVEKIKDNIYHWDEGTKALPGGATDEDGNMNNPSSMYFVQDEDGVILIDLGNGATAGSDAEAAAKTIIQEMVGDKPLTIIITHGHGDHTGFGRSTAVWEGINVEKVIVPEADYAMGEKALAQFIDAGKVETVVDGDDLTVYGATYHFDVVPCHTEGSLMITDRTHEALYTGDTFGSGFIWALWGMNDGNPIAALSAGLAEARTIMNEIPRAAILAGHRWQQFDESNPQRPNEMSIQYFNDMAQVINGLLDGTTISNPYNVVAWAPDAIELSSNGAKAKIDTRPEFVEAYKAAVNAMDEAYVYSASDKLSIESYNNNAAATFVIYPDGYMSDEEALQYITDSGIKDIIDRSASKVYVARPQNGESFTAEDFAGFKTIVGKIGVSANFKLIGIGNGATFINQNLTDYMNFVSGLALINPEAGSEVKVSVPTYLVTDDQKVIDTYVKANSAEEVSEGYYANPESRYEIVVVNDDTDIDPIAATQDAWTNVLAKFGRIGNYSEVYKETATWYSRPLITGNDEVDQTRKYQYFESTDAIENMHREVVVEDLDGDGIDSLWYEYIPEEAMDAKDGTIPVVILLHGNTNDPRTQYDTSGWANVASEEGIILICPEWQGHTFQGYTYDPMTDDDNQTPDSDLITMLKMIEEKYPQIDQSRIYVSGLSRGSGNTTNLGLSNPKYFAAGAGHSGPFGASDINNEMAAANKDQYDMPIIFFTGDGDEYCKGAFDTTELNGGLQVARAYQLMNDMEVTQVEDVLESDTYLYGVPWTTRYTIEPNAENIAKVDVGMIENDKGVEISMARIYGWGHWNYAPDAEWMWNFMSRYARDLETGESIRLDKETPDTPDTPDTPETPETPETPTTPDDGVNTGDHASIMPVVSVAGLAMVALAVIVVLKNRNKKFN